MPATIEPGKSESASAVPLPSPIGRYRWVVCALLFFATTINYIDRQILSLLKEILDEQIGWTNEQFGWVNSAFQFAYGIGLLGFGWFVDRFGTKIGYSVSIIAWSVAAAAHALVGSFVGFIGARTALGLGEGGNFPSAIKAVALWFPKRERAFATSIFNAGTNAGALVAPAVIPWMAYQFGWQSCFITAGLVGLLWLFLWIPFYDVPDKSRRVGAAELELIRSDQEPERPQEKVSWLSLLGYRQTWSFFIAKFLTDPVWWFFLIWLPDFFKKTRGLEIKKSWIHIVTIYGIVTVLSIFGGWITGYLTKQGWSVTRARKTGMFIFALCVLPILLVTRVGDWTAVLLIGLAGAAHQAWSANLFTTVSDMFPKKAVASVIGIGGMAGSAGGIMFPALTGRLLDHFQHQGNITAGYAILFGICGCIYLVAFALHHLLAPRFELFHLKESAS
ncbi:MAG: MFS transporter [Verrucomicrobia bacterium]|mgnify:CR=1 FL=1|jgi:ACS family hexuronate transporter-like MFS transporter|nr:MFS transporter [Verrucomicrobiota bacterium]OQC26303.1 MAG: Hexuronate transporter [Verrucomicrobia bacterium ADurb.Bin063]MBP8013798.1 MFS transporter [Verrucomicrobiota bacterium]HNW06535.1 MFS transporter [Verrucomicrobiota bacterium]HNZ74788.1 MFS transporter [Verrucomicrobiota bacterium]